MDISEYVGVSTFGGRGNLRQQLSIAAGIALSLTLVEQYNSGVSRLLKSLKRGAAAAISDWLEGQAGIALFTLEGEEPPPYVARHHFGRRSKSRTAASEDTATSIKRSNSGSSRGTGASFAPPSLSFHHANAPSSAGNADTPIFFQSTKFFACLDVEEAKELFESATKVQLSSYEVLFQSGDSSDSGIFIVVEGSLGVFLQKYQHQDPVHTNTLRYGESVGDLDVVDGASRTVTCIALDEGCSLVQISRALFLSFVHTHPYALISYMQQAMGRLWRVAHFLLVDFLQVPFGKIRMEPEYTSKRSGSRISTLNTRLFSQKVTKPRSARRISYSEPPKPAVHQNTEGKRSIDENGLLERDPTQSEMDITQSQGECTFLNSTDDALESNWNDLSRFESGTFGSRATLKDGWDIVSITESGLSSTKWRELAERQAFGHPMKLKTGEILQQQDQMSGQFYLLVSGHLIAERETADNVATFKASGTKKSVIESAIVDSGSLISCAAFLSHTVCSCRILAAERAILLSFTWQKLHQLASADVELLIQLLLASSKALGRVIRHFISLGLNRVWLKSGDHAFRQGDNAECFFVVISGRLRLLREEVTSGMNGQKSHVRVEEELGRGEAIGAVWAVAGGAYDTTALCVRDSELVRMSRPAFQVIAGEAPTAMSRLLENMTRRLVAAWDARQKPHMRHLSPFAVSNSQLESPAPRMTADTTKRGEIVSLAIVPAGTCGENLTRSGAVEANVAAASAVKRLVATLKTALQEYGPVLLLNSTNVRLLFPGAFDKMDNYFYRSKVTSWMAAQEEEYRFIILESDMGITPWSSVCVSQADCTLLVAAEGAKAGLTSIEQELVWQHFGGYQDTQGSQDIYSTQLDDAMLRERDGSVGPSESSLACSQVALEEKGSTQGSQKQPQVVSPFSVGCNLPIMPGSTFSDLPSTAASDFLSKRTRDGDISVAITPTAVASGLGPVGSLQKGGSFSSFARASVVLPTAASIADSEIPRSRVEYTEVTGEDTGPADEQNKPLYRIDGLRRVELVLLHSGAAKPSGTAAWLDSRPLLARHHQIRLSQHGDVSRLARWIAGRAVGLVLSGGGSRGLAHLGVLCALNDLGVPVDVIGGTSQGAFMAALFAQGLSRETLNSVVREYAAQLGSVRHLLSDLTLPLLSVFSGKAFASTLKRSFAHGVSLIEDLWLPFFCVSTNLSRGEPTAHQRGDLATLVRASMTIVGLLPPVYEDGDLHVDGGYMNNVPVDVMRGLGVDTVIVVDVEDKDAGNIWRELNPYDGGVSGWKLLWDRYLPSWITSNKPLKLPRYAQILNQLTWMTHAHNLRRVSEEYRIDLYLRPPNIGYYKLMDYHLADRIVKDSYRYAWTAVSNWQSMDKEHESSGSGQTRTSRSASVTCMTQLKKRQMQSASSASSDVELMIPASSLRLSLDEQQAAGQSVPSGPYRRSPLNVSSQMSADGNKPRAAASDASAKMDIGLAASNMEAPKFDPKIDRDPILPEHTPMTETANVGSTETSDSTNPSQALQGHLENTAKEAGGSGSSQSKSEKRSQHLKLENLEHAFSTGAMGDLPSSTLAAARALWSIQEFPYKSPSPSPRIPTNAPAPPSPLKQQSNLESKTFAASPTSNVQPYLSTSPSNKDAISTEKESETSPSGQAKTQSKKTFSGGIPRTKSSRSALNTAAGDDQ